MGRSVKQIFCPLQHEKSSQQLEPCSFMEQGKMFPSLTGDMYYFTIECRAMRGGFIPFAKIKLLRQFFCKFEYTIKNVIQ